MFDRLNKKLMTPRILWAAFLFTQAAFLVVLLVAPTPREPEQPELVPILAFVSLSIAVASFVVPTNLLRASVKAKKFTIEERADPDAVGLYRDTAPKKRFFADPERAMAASLPGYMTAFIISIGLSEAVTINGLLLGLLGHPLSHALPFFAVGTLLIAVRFPRFVTISSALETSYDARLVAGSANDGAA